METELKTEVVKQEKTLKPVKIEKTQVPQPPQKLIYCGADIPNVLVKHTIYEGALPEYLKEHMQKCPFIEKLLVPISKLGEIQNLLNTKGSAQQIFNEKILQYTKTLKDGGING